MLSPFRWRITRQVLAFLAMIVVVLPTTGAPDQVALLAVSQSTWEVGAHGHGHVDEFDSGWMSSAVGSDIKHNHGHNQADHSHDAAGLIPTMSASPACCQRFWHPQCPWMSVSHAPFLLERPPRTLVA